MAGANAASMASAIGSTASGLAGALSQIGGYKRAEKSTRRLSEWNYLNSASLQKQGMKNAGLSTAGFGDLGNQAGTETSQPQPRDMSSAFGNLQQGFGATTNSLVALAQIRKDNADAQNQEIKNNYEEERQKAEIGTIKVQLDLFKDSFDEQVETFKLNNQKLFSEIAKNQKDLEYINQQIENLKASLEGINIDNKYKADHWQAVIGELNARIRSTIVQTKLAPLLAQSTIGLQSAQTGYYNELSHLTSQQTIGQKLLNQHQHIENASQRIAYDVYERTGIDGTQGLWQNVFGLAGRFGLEFSEVFAPIPMIKNIYDNAITPFFKKNFGTYMGFRQFHTKDK